MLSRHGEACYPWHSERDRKVRFADRLRCFAIGGSIVECNRDSTSLTLALAASAVFLLVCLRCSP